MINRLTDYRGAQYYTELRRILNSDEGKAIVEEFNAVKLANGKTTPFDLCVITINHNLPFKAVVEWLEKSKVAPTGLYDRLIERGFKVNEGLQIARERIKRK